MVDVKFYVTVILEGWVDGYKSQYIWKKDLNYGLNTSFAFFPWNIVASLDNHTLKIMLNIIVVRYRSTHAINAILGATALREYSGVGPSIQ